MLPVTNGKICKRFQIWFWLQIKEKILLFLKLNENDSKFQPDNENGVECRPKLGGMNQALGLNPDLLQRIFRKFDGGFQMITEARSSEIVKKMRDAAISKAAENCIQVHFFISFSVSELQKLFRNCRLSRNCRNCLEIAQEYLNLQFTPYSEFVKLFANELCSFLKVFQFTL